MGDFHQAMRSIRAHEGWDSNNQLDKGGATRCGISLRFLKSLPLSAGDVNGDGHVSPEDVFSLTPEEIDHFYHCYFWSHYQLGLISDQRVATKLFNLFVNMRGKTAGLIAQRACNDLGARLKLDGIVGSHSRSVLNSTNPEQLLVCIKFRAWEVYKAIVARDPEQVVFLDGWRRRAFANV